MAPPCAGVEPSCHEKYGDALAINAGNTAYFLLDEMIENLNWTAERKLTLYRLFFQTMRCAHAGHALDIAGLRPIVEKALVSEDYSGTLDQVSQTPRLKTGIPVVLCLAIGALHAGAAGKAYETLLSFGEVLGKAFQIGDDVLNLSGFAGDLKDFGEDIAHGKFTFPIAWALERLPNKKSAELARYIIAESACPKHLKTVLALLQEVNAIEASKEYAREIVNDSWEELKPHLQDNKASQQLFELAERFIDRHY